LHLSIKVDLREKDKRERERVVLKCDQNKALPTDVDDVRTGTLNNNSCTTTPPQQLQQQLQEQLPQQTPTTNSNNKFPQQIPTTNSHNNSNNNSKF
jgi:hypothetical protein